MNSFDTLANVTPDMIVEYPFPHIVISNALAPDVYEKLDAVFPLESMTQDYGIDFQARRYPNTRWQDVDPIWNDFHRYHDSVEFKDKILDFFKKFIDPDKYARYHSSSHCEVIKNWTTFTVNGLSEIRVQSPHVDNARNFYVGLFYMRDNEDLSTGGDLEIYESVVDTVEFGPYRKPKIEHIRLYNTVPYRANTMVWMLTGEKSIHGASSRIGATKFRKYVNINTRVSELAHTY